MNTHLPQIVSLLLLLLAQPARLAFAAETENWEPPKESGNEEGTTGLISGEQAYLTFVSTASFAEVWSHYARKLGVEHPERSGRN
jgi:hypothetical protein